MTGCARICPNKACASPRALRTCPHSPFDYALYVQRPGTHSRRCRSAAQGCGRNLVRALGCSSMCRHCRCCTRAWMRTSATCAAIRETRWCAPCRRRASLSQAVEYDWSSIGYFATLAFKMTDRGSGDVNPRMLRFFEPGSVFPLRVARSTGSCTAGSARISCWWQETRVAGRRADPPSFANSSPLPFACALMRSPGQELAREDRLRQRVFHLLLDGALERPRAVHRVVARLAQAIERRVIERELEIAVEQSRLSCAELDVDDGADLRLAQRMEHADVVDAVDELRPEVLPAPLP